MSFRGDTKCLTRRVWITHTDPAEVVAELRRRSKVTSSDRVSGYRAAADLVAEKLGVATLAALEVTAGENDANRTIFECRICGAHTGGFCNGEKDQPGWGTIARIDGPDSICPECLSNPNALDGLRDEYPDARTDAPTPGAAR